MMSALGIVASARVASVAAFDPISLSDKMLWLRAKDLGANGSAATPWADALTGRTASAGDAPTVVTGATPNGGKAVLCGNSNGGYALPYLPWSVDASSATTAPTSVLDGNTSTVWISTASLPAWLRFRLQTAYAATSYIITAASSGKPTAWTFDGSNDGLAWTTLDTQSGQVLGTLIPTTYNFTNGTAYKWYRINIATATATSARVAEFSIPGSTIDANGPGEAWMVMRSSGSTRRGPLLGSSGITQYPQTDGVRIDDNTGLAASQIITPTMLVVNQWRLVRATSDGTYTYWLDNVLQHTASAAVSWRSSALPTFTAQLGHVAELFVRGKVSDATEIANLITYFNNEHGLAVPGGS